MKSTVCVRVPGSCRRRCFNHGKLGPPSCTPRPTSFVLRTAAPAAERINFHFQFHGSTHGKRCKEAQDHGSPCSIRHLPFAFVAFYCLHFICYAIRTRGSTLLRSAETQKSAHKASFGLDDRRKLIRINAPAGLFQNRIWVHQQPARFCYIICLHLNANGLPPSSEEGRTGRKGAGRWAAKMVCNNHFCVCQRAHVAVVIVTLWRAK